MILTVVGGIEMNRRRERIATPTLDEFLSDKGSAIYKLGRHFK